MADVDRRDIVVIGGSAGSLRALRELLAALPSGFPAAVHVVMHVAPDSPRVLSDILDRSGPLPAVYARQRAPLAPGRVVLAPPDHHLMLERDGARLSHGPRENMHRPSIDVLFRSAAAAFGPRVIGVLLSGMLDDGSAGLWAIKVRGGLALVQDPAEAEYPDMPRNALRTTRADTVAGVAGLAARLLELVGQPVGAPAEAPATMTSEVRMATDERIDESAMDALGGRTSLTCPECGGALWEVRDSAVARYRCHVGHAYSLLALAAEQSTRVEAALWAALRALEENARISDRMAQSAGDRGEHRRAELHRDRLAATQQHADALREMLERATYVDTAPDADGTASG